MFKIYNKIVPFKNTIVGKFFTTEGRKINISETCVKQLQKLAQSNKDIEKYLRLTVEGGGCSGFQYKFDLDSKKNDDDIIFEKDGVAVIIDSTSLDFVNGSTVDYHEELIRSAFVVKNNPKAELGCSCGASFSIKLD